MHDSINEDIIKGQSQSLDASSPVEHGEDEQQDDGDSQESFDPGKEYERMQ